MTSFKAIFGIGACEAWRDFEIDGMEDEPAGLVKQISNLHKVLVLNSERAQTQVGKFYDKAVYDTNYEKEDRVLSRDKEVSTKDGNKIVRPWIGPYDVAEKLGRVGC